MEFITYAEIKYMTRLAQKIGKGENEVCKVLTLCVKWYNSGCK